MGKLAFAILLVAMAVSAKPKAKSPGLQNCLDRDEFAVTDASDQKLNFETFAQTLAPIDSVDFYDKLTSNPDFSEFARNTMQMGMSRSAQKAATSPAHPRLISYHPMGIFLGLVDPVDLKLEAFKYFFEGIEYDYSKNEWAPFRGEMSYGQVTIDRSYEATESCYGCHGTPFRPIWRSYRAWPGQLSDFTSSYSYSYANHQGNRFAKYIKGGYGDPGQMLMMQLNRLNYRRMHARLKENPNWDKFRPATVAALLGCEDIPSFLGPKTRAPLVGPNGNRFEELKADVLATIEFNHLAEVKFAESINDRHAISELNQNNEIYDSTRMASLRFLFELSGTNVKSFGLSRPPGRNSVGYGFNQVGTSSGGVHNFLCQVLPEYYKKGGKAKAPLKWSPYDSSSYGGYLPSACAQLKYESLRLNP